MSDLRKDHIIIAIVFGLSIVVGVVHFVCIFFAQKIVAKAKYFLLYQILTSVSDHFPVIIPIIGPIIGPMFCIIDMAGPIPAASEDMSRPVFPIFFASTDGGRIRGRLCSVGGVSDTVSLCVDDADEGMSNFFLKAKMPAEATSMSSSCTIGDDVNPPPPLRQYLR